MIPGSNLLKQALTVIAPQTVSYYQATGRSANVVGQFATTYASPVNLKGSFQPVPRSLYEEYGLDFQKDYFVFYSTTNLIDVQRDVSADQLQFNSKRFQCLSSNDWFSIDGWLGILCVLISGQAN